MTTGNLHLISRELLPLTRKAPAKLHDTGLLRLVGAGFGLWNPNAGRLMALPMGARALDDLAQSVTTALGDLSPQSVLSGSDRGPLEFALRLLKRPDDLPRLFVERTGSRLILQGFAGDVDQAHAMAGDALRALGASLTSWGLTVRRVERTTDEGPAFDLACVATGPHDGDAGFTDRAGALMALDTPLAAPSWQCDDGTPVDVSTPNCSTIDELATFMSIDRRATVKSMGYQLADRRFVLVICRGDRKVNGTKLRVAFRGVDYHPATAEELNAVLGDVAGYIGPIDLPQTVSLLADTSVPGCRGVVVGARKPGYHTRGVNWGRDFSTDWIADVTDLQADDETAAGSLTPAVWRRLARFLPVDERLLDPSLTVGGPGGKRPIAPWSATVDLMALAASLAENGLMNRLTAPYQAFLVTDDAPDLRAQTVSRLLEDGFCLLEDDRNLSATVRLADGTALGLPRILLNGAGIVWLIDDEREERLQSAEDLSAHLWAALQNH